MLLPLLALAATATFAVHAPTTLLRAYEARRGTGAPPKHPLAAVALAWFGEWIAQTVALLALPLRALPSRPDQVAPDGQAILLVPGWGLGALSLFFTARRLRARGHTVHIADVGRAVGRYEQEAPALTAQILRRAEAAAVSRYDVLTHGDGGLLIRLAAVDPILSPKLGNIVTLGCPHGGTAPAHLLRGSAGACLRPNSNFLQRLAEHNQWPGHGHATAIASEMDAIVFPTILASWQDALNVRIELVGHCSLLISERSFQLACENLEHRASR